MLAAAAVLAGCGGADGSADVADAGSSSAAAPVLGPVNKATGEPLRIGFVSTGLSATVDTTDQIRGAEAVAAYANEHLGGIHGRPLQLVVCEEKGTPAGAQACGTRFIQEGVLAVNAGSSGQIGTVVKTVDAAGIPSLLGLAAATEALQGAHALVWGNPLAIFGGGAAFAREQGNKRVAVLVIDTPGSTGSAQQLSPLFFGNAGATAQVIPVAPGTADMSPQIQAAVNNKVDQFHILGNPAFCASALKAIRTLGVRADVTVIDQCVNAEAAKSIPGGFAGVTVILQANSDPSTDEYKLFEAVLSTYGKGVQPNTTSSSGYQGALGLVRALNAASVTDFTPAGLEKAVREMPPALFPLGAGATFQCNGKALSFSKNICSTFSAAGEAREDGSIASFRTIDSEGIYVTPAR